MLELNLTLTLTLSLTLSLSLSLTLTLTLNLSRHAAARLTFQAGLHARSRRRPLLHGEQRRLALALALA